MADLTDSEARAMFAIACEPGDVRIGKLISQFGAVGLINMRHLLPDDVRVRLPLQAPILPSNVEWLTPESELWPIGLNDLGAAAPLGIWLQGKFNVQPAISIVGSRSASEYGEYVASEWSAELATAGFTIISGGAIGIDAAAHRGALAVSGQTVAVMAGGLDQLYPRANSVLFERILNRGAIVSELPLGVPPFRHRFLIRNRIIAAWSQLTLVVEARERSGAIATAGHAAVLGRDVAAVPGQVNAAASVGCHQLIRDGAVLVTSPKEVIELIGR